jgi:hypothetical protein
MHKLKDGPVWARSLQTFHPLVARLLESGHIQHVKPPGGRTSSMLGLSTKGARLMGVAAPTDTCIDRFAERLAEHGNVKLAAQEINVSPHYGRVLLQRIRKQLGWQAQ